MVKNRVTFRYYPGTYTDIFGEAQLVLEGSWNADGGYSDQWQAQLMTRLPGDDGGACYQAELDLRGNAGDRFHWGVRAHFQDGRQVWAIPTELHDGQSTERYRSLTLGDAPQTECYYLTHCRRLGANKFRRPDGELGVRFAVWAPYARQVELAFGTLWDSKDPKRKPTRDPLPMNDIAGGYIADDGSGMDPEIGLIPLVREPDGVWVTPLDHPALAVSAPVLNHRPYMYRVTLEDGSIAWRTDLYSRCQVGSGAQHPDGTYLGLVQDLAGPVSCSVTVDPELVTRYFAEESPYLVTTPPSQRIWPERHFIPADTFWSDEFGARPLPERIEDLIIYELHLGALGFGKPGPGTLEDAIALLDHLVELNVNAIELLPLAEFGGQTDGWGYQTSHYFAIEYSGGGRDQFKFFVRECHRRGLVVIVDVVFNHYAANAERAEFAYDSRDPRHNLYYWYEGNPGDYATADGGYVDNLSSGWAPRYHEEYVRKMFISSAVALLTEFHVDGLRVDQTTSIHGYNVLHADGRPVPAANQFGAKLLRELGNTLRLVRPGVFLMAEDHSDWDQVTLPVERGGMGFDARWYADFYHHLAGDTEQGDKAKLLYRAATNGSDSPLQMDWFAGALSASGDRKVVYSESHDEAGNSKGPFLDPEANEEDKRFTSERTIVVAVNGAPLVDETRRYAEARCRFAWGITALSAGVPMFLFGEEVGFRQRFKYNAVIANKEDIHGMRRSSGQNLYRFYQDINGLRLGRSGLRSRQLQLVHVHNDNRLLAFLRWDDDQRFLVVASLADHPYDDGYNLSHPAIGDSEWQEVFNSDSSHYGGDNIGNLGGMLAARGGDIRVVVPHAGFVVLQARH